MGPVRRSLMSNLFVVSNLWKFTVSRIFKWSSSGRNHWRHPTPLPDSWNNFVSIVINQITGQFLKEPTLNSGLIWFLVVVQGFCVLEAIKIRWFISTKSGKRALNHLYILSVYPIFSQRVCNVKCVKLFWLVHVKRKLQKTLAHNSLWFKQDKQSSSDSLWLSSL